MSTMRLGPSPQRVAAVRRALRPLREAVQAGDDGAFRAELFADEGSVVSLEMADMLRFGFVAPRSTLDTSWSLAELCFHSEQPGMLRIALESRRPAMVDGLALNAGPAWRQHLCTRHLFQQFAAHSLGGLACWHHDRPAAAAFAELGAEFDLEDAEQAALAAAEEGRALVRAAQMRLRIRLAGNRDAPNLAAPQAASAAAATRPPQRRHRMV